MKLQTIKKYFSRVVFRQLAITNGDLVAISYAQINFPQFASVYNEGIFVKFIFKV